MNVIYRMFIYDLTYTLADQLIKKYNPCHIRTLESGEVKCLRFVGPCCTDCRHLDKNGCTVTCLGCKLWVCEHIEEFRPNFTRKIASIKTRILWLYGLMPIRSSRQETYTKLRGLSRWI